MSLPLTKAINFLVCKLQQLSSKSARAPKKIAVQAKVAKKKQSKQKKAAWFITTCKKCSRTYDCGHYFHECEKQEVSKGKFVWVRRDILRRSMVETIESGQLEDIELPTTR